MQITPQFGTHLATALGLGVGVSLVLWLFRGHPLVRRVRGPALVTVLLYGLYLMLEGTGVTADSFVLKTDLGLFILLGAGTLLQLLDWLLWDYLFEQRRHIVIPRLIIDVFNFIVLTAVALVVLNQVFGVKDLSALLVTSTVLSAVIGLALQDMLGNIIAGLALQLEHPFSVGDWVRLSGEEGQVTQVNWRAITLRTRDNHNILLPNSKVAKEFIINYSRPTPLQRMRAQVAVAYAHPPGLVKEVLAQAIAEAPGVMAEPAPRVQVRAYGDFAVEYEILYWITDFAHQADIHDSVMTRVWYALKRAGLSIPFPIRDVTVRMLAGDHAAQAQAQQQREVFAELRRISLFAPLTDAQIEQLALSAALERYAAGEVLVRQGDAGQSLFVVKAGQVRVDMRSDGGQVTTVAHFGPDQFFGEMSLLTGEPRSASVIAEGEVEVVVLDKAGMAAVIESDKRIPEALSEALEARARQSLERVAAGTGPLTSPPVAPQPALLGRIRRFFGIGSG